MHHLAIQPGASSRGCLRQQFLFQRGFPQKPAPPDRLVSHPVLRPAPLLHYFLQPTPPRHAVLGDMLFTQQPVHRQPRPAFARTLQILRPTAPLIIPQVLPRTHQLRPRRIQMDVIAHCPQIPVPAPIHNQRLVPPAEQVPKHLVPPVKPRRIGAQKPFHPRHQVGLRRLHHQMKMIRHQAQCQHLPPRLPARLPQRGQKPPPILIILENRLPPVPPAQHMVDSSRILNS